MALEKALNVSGITKEKIFLEGKKNEEKHSVT